MIIIFTIILLVLVYALWMAGEIYNPRPTPVTTSVIVLPPKATATDYPTATQVKATPIQPTLQPEPTFTPISATFTPVLISTVTQAPTSTMIPTVIPPTQVPVLGISAEPECFVMTANVWRATTRLVRCEKITTYTEYRYMFDYQFWLGNFCQGCQAPPVPYSTPRDGFPPRGTPRP